MNIVSTGGQHTEAWFEERLGKLTGSRISAAITEAKRKSTGELQARMDLKLELAVERVTRRPVAHYTSEWMERGSELEPLALAAYELRTGVALQSADFVRHPSIEMAGCSPDSFCGNVGIQVKVPKPTTHAKYLLGECVPSEYQDQMMWEIAVCGWESSDFVSYCPEFPDPLDLFICRLLRDKQRIAVMEAQASVFLKETADLTLRLTHGLEGLLRESLVSRAQIPAWEGSLSDA